MKTTVVVLLIVVLFGCKTSECPTTNKKYFTKGVKTPKSLYSGYKSQKGNQIHLLTNKNKMTWKK